MHPQRLKEGLSEESQSLFEQVQDVLQDAEEIGGPTDYYALMEVIRQETGSRLNAQGTKPEEMTPKQIRIYKAVLESRILDWGGPDGWTIGFDLHGNSIYCVKEDAEAFFYLTPLHEGLVDELPVALDRGDGYLIPFDLSIYWTGKVGEDLKRYKSKFQKVRKITGL